MSDTGTTDTGIPVDNGDDMTRLRAEAASWRKKLRDIEAAQPAALDAARAEGRSELVGRLTDTTIGACAQGRGFANPADAIALVKRDGLLDQDGLPDNEKIAAAVDALLAERPHLAAKRFAGSAEQGVRTSPPTKTGDWGRDLLAHSRDGK